MVRTNPDAMTAQEAAAWNESGADEMFRQSFEESMQAQEAAQARDMQRDTLKANLTNQLTATNRYTPEQAAVNAELAAAGYAAMAQRSGMSIDELYGMMPLNVVSDGLTGAGFDQALASNPPRGWVHAQDGAAAADLWNGNGQAQAVFWTGDNPKLAEQFPELAGYSVSVDKFAVEHIRKNHGDFESEAARGQIAVTEADIERIPQIVADYDAVRFENIAGTNNKRMAFAKAFDDGVMVYLADTSKKRRDLRTVSAWKYPQSANAHEVLNHAVSLQTLTSETKGGISHADYDTPADYENQLFQSAFDGTPQESFENTAAMLGGEAAHAQAVSDGLNQQVRGFFNPRSNTIALLQQADASTFAHELGHFFLEMQSNLAQRAVLRDMQGVATDTEKQIIRDMDAVLKWFGVKAVKGSDGQEVLSALQVWRDMELDEQREYHEQFARGFEAYLFEGKAPSAELRGVFRRFAAWLKHVYRRLANLNVRL